MTLRLVGATPELRFGVPQDTNLYRATTNTLQTDGSLLAVNDITARWGVTNQVQIGSVLAKPGVNFGISNDTVLYRDAPGALKTEGSFSASGPYFMYGAVGGQGAGVRYLSGAGGTTSWYMNAATGGAVYLAVGETAYLTASATAVTTPVDFTARSGGAAQITLADNGSGASTIWFGTGFSDYIYHPSAGNLTTNCTFNTQAMNVNGALAVTGNEFVNGYIAFAQAQSLGASGLLTSASGDAYYRWYITNGGTMNWGDGTNATDVSMARWSAGRLNVQNTLMLGLGTSPGTSGLEVYANAAAGQPTIELLNNSYIWWGPGSAGVDTNLYRVSAGLLKTDGALGFGPYGFSVRPGTGSPNAGRIDFGDGTGWRLDFTNSGGANRVFSVYDTGTLAWGASSDTFLYRAAANVLKTDGSFRVNQYLDVDFQDIGAKLRFGSAVDTNLYRSAAGTLKTDGTIQAAGSFVASTAGAGHVYIRNDAGHIYFGVGDDTNLYRSAAGNLKTDGVFFASGINDIGNLNCFKAGASYAQVTIALDYAGAGLPGMVFGTGTAAGDTNLYRYSAGFLATSGDFVLNPQGIGLRGIQVGAPDSGGTGYRMLRVTN